MMRKKPNLKSIKIQRRKYKLNIEEIRERDKRNKKKGLARQKRVPYEQPILPLFEQINNTGSIFKNLFKEKEVKSKSKKELKPKQITETYTFKNENKEDNITDIKYLDEIKKDVENKIKTFKENEHNAIKFFISIEVKFYSQVRDENFVRHFNHGYRELYNMDDFDDIYKYFLDEFIADISEENLGISSLTLISINKVNLKMVKINTLRGSSYIELPHKSPCILNIQNNDNKCFLYSILAHLHKLEKNDHPQRPQKYKYYEDEINMEGIKYPVSLHDLPTFEKQNNISLYVFSVPSNATDYSEINPQYISKYPLSKHPNREVIDLLYIEDGENSHYCLIKNLNGLLTNNKNKVYYCRECQTRFTTEKGFKDHKHEIKDIMPKNGENIIKFENYHQMHKLPFVIYCDFEATNNPIQSASNNPNNSSIEKKSLQEAISYGMYIKSDYPEIIESFYETYTGEDATQEFVKMLMIYFNKIINNVKNNKKYFAINLTRELREQHNNTNNCYMCNSEFTTENKKIIEHNHFNGKYRGAACESCNKKEGRNIKRIPVFFHNGSRYDFHFIIEEIMKYENENTNISVLAKTSEEYISIQIMKDWYKLVFLDSYRFLSSPLENVVLSIPKEQLKITKEEFKDIKQFNLISQKGVYPYEYIDSIERLHETRLPDKDKFNSTLTNSKISVENYERAKEVWNVFNCKTLLDYHNLYLKADVLLLADAFENLRKVMLDNHKIDPCYSYSAPGLTWQAGLKYTGIKLELLTDNEMFQMIESGIRGGFSGVLGKRYVKANNKYLEDYDKNKPNTYLMYLDCNNLYGVAMSQKLPTRDFKWETDKDYYKRIPQGRGCIVECDLQYMERTKTLTWKFPLAPEGKIIEEDQLSDIQRYYLEVEKRKLGKTKKLILDLHDKKKYVVHHSILKYYEKLGLKVTKVHRTISFEEDDWLKKYISFNTNQRSLAKTVFEKDFWKLLNNAFFGKTMENVRNRIELKLVRDQIEAKKLFSKTTFSDYIDYVNFYGILMKKKSVKLDKPIYLGLSILDSSKLAMYKFYYEYINKVWSKNQIIGYDTDSFFLEIQTEDVYDDIKNKLMDEMDTSDYPKEHKLYDEKNKKVVGKFKDELNGSIMSEIAFVKSKLYAYKKNIYSGDIKEEKKLKGISKHIIKDMIFEEFKNIILIDKPEPIKKVVYTLNSENHKMYMNKQNKIALSAFDDKRYILDDGITTIPHCDSKFRNKLINMLLKAV